MSDLIQTERKGKYLFVTLNRPSKKNALNKECYDRLPRLLHEANSDPDLVFTVFTGIGDFFCAGSDFSLDNAAKDKLVEHDRKPIYADFITALIEHNKILVAFVNGPAIGLGVTMLTQFDLVIATEKAYFLTPFSKLGLTAEGTSTYTFPASMGRLNANRMLLFSETIKAPEAKELGLVTEVHPESQFAQICQQRLKELDKLAPGSLLETKAVMMKDLRGKLRNAHAEEVETLERKYKGEEMYEFLIRSIKQRKAKL